MRFARVFISSSFLLGISLSAQADFGGLPSIQPNSLVSDDVMNAITSLIGLGFQQRPYEPATPLGIHVGVDLSIEATLAKVPDSFFTALSGAGFPMDASALTALPVARIHLHKGMGESVDVGGSALWLLGNKVLGADAKYVFLQGDEIPTWAFRFCYTYTDLSAAGLNISTKTFSPQLLVSRQMEFADPYLGIAYSYATGVADADIVGIVNSATGIGTDTIPLPSLHKTGTAQGAMAFGGISLKLPRSGARMTLEFSYNTAGTSTLGTKIGMAF